MIFRALKFSDLILRFYGPKTLQSGEFSGPKTLQTGDGNYMPVSSTYSKYHYNPAWTIFLLFLNNYNGICMGQHCYVYEQHRTLHLSEANFYPL